MLRSEVEKLILMELPERWTGRKSVLTDYYWKSSLLRIVPSTFGLITCLFLGHLRVSVRGLLAELAIFQNLASIEHFKR